MSTEAIPQQFTGYAAKDEAAGKALKVAAWSYTPQKWHEALVDIKISHCSICGSCIHTLKNTWPSPTAYPCIAGHEIIGTVVRAGSASGHAVGERVGVGAQAGACGECKFCKASQEPFCANGLVGTYQGKWEDGSVAQGGYADFVRVKGQFAVQVPEQLKSADAAPLMCAGITVYNPLKTAGVAPGKKVAIVGIGGLGHLGLLFSNALGAETYAISHSSSKVQDAAKLGVQEDHFIIAQDEAATATKWANTFDLILCTSFQNNLPIDSLYFKMLAPGGRLTIVGLPEEQMPRFWGQALVGKGLSFGGSLIGPPSMIAEMLQLAVEHNIRPWISEHPMAELERKLKDMDEGKARYRFVMTN